MAASGPVVERRTVERLSAEYRRTWGIRVYATDSFGGRVLGPAPPCEARLGAACARARANACRESLRWGEAAVGACPARKLVWAVPLMHNQATGGALVACVDEKRAFARGRQGAGLDVRRAATELRHLAERHDLTNAAALAAARGRQVAERRTFAIPAFAEAEHRTIRELYLRFEPALFSAVRSGDRPSARSLLNQILVEIHNHAGERIDLMKSYFLELVVSMCRTTVESGAEPERLLGASFSRMTELAAIHTEEDLAPWLASVLEHLMDEIESARGRGSPQRLFDAIAFMQRHCCERVSRDEVARAAHVSGSHFSYLLRRDSGATFTDLLNRMRTDRAAELLVSTDRQLSLIAVETGFSDQSYFTKVFKRNRGVPPLEFRKRNAARMALPAAPVDLSARPATASRD